MKLNPLLAGLLNRLPPPPPTRPWTLFYSDGGEIYRAEPLDLEKLRFDTFPPVDIGNVTKEI